MMYPVVAPSSDVGGPSGYTYACVLVRLDGVPAGALRTRAEVLAALREIRFSGWLAQPEDGWVVAVAASGNGTVAAGRRGVVGVGEWLADRLNATVVAVRVVSDRQLLLAAWLAGEEVGRYVSDPSYGLSDEEDVLPDPLGVEYAAAFAAACGHPPAADELAELLAEQLDPDSVIESERLGALLRLLQPPRWLVAATALPRDVPTGPRAADMTRLGAGVPGVAGWLCGRAVNVIRRRRRPPPAIADPPRGAAGIDPWVF